MFEYELTNYKTINNESIYLQKWLTYERFKLKNNTDYVDLEPKQQPDLYKLYPNKFASFHLLSQYNKKEHLKNEKNEKLLELCFR